MTFIGQNPPAKLVESTPLRGTHNGGLNVEARIRRAAKKARYLQNVQRRAEENRNGPSAMKRTAKN